MWPWPLCASTQVDLANPGLSGAASELAASEKGWWAGLRRGLMAWASPMAGCCCEGWSRSSPASACVFRPSPLPLLPGSQVAPRWGSSESSNCIKFLTFGWVSLLLARSPPTWGRGRAGDGARRSGASRLVEVGGLERPLQQQLDAELARLQCRACALRGCCRRATVTGCWRQLAGVTQEVVGLFCRSRSRSGVSRGMSNSFRCPGLNLSVDVSQGPESHELFTVLDLNVWWCFDDQVIAHWLWRGWWSLVFCVIS